MSWSAHNLAYLSARLDGIRFELELEKARITGESESSVTVATDATWQGESMTASTFQLVSARAGLQPFEEKLFLLCIGMELDARFPSLCAELHGNPEVRYPTFSLALRALSGAHWDALAMHSGIRAHRLVQIEDRRLVVQGRMYTDERVWQSMLGISGLDHRLQRLLEPCAQSADIVDSHKLTAQMIIDGLHLSAKDRLPTIQLTGRSCADQVSVAASVTSHLGFVLYRISASDLPEPGPRLEEILQLWERECLLANVALFVDSYGASDA